MGERLYLSDVRGRCRCLLSESVCNGNCEQRKAALMLPDGSRCKLCRKKVKQRSRDRRFCNGLCAAGDTVAVPKEATRNSQLATGNSLMSMWKD